MKTAEIRPSEIWIKSKPLIRGRKGYLIFDDTVLDKSRSNSIELVNKQYSGNAHGLVNGIGMANAVWRDAQSEQYIPVDFRVYDKDVDGKTKNDHFRDMLSLSVDIEIDISAVIFDSWYSSLNNLKAVRSHELTWVAGLKKNRRINKNQILSDVCIPHDGLKVHLRGYGWITVFKFVAKNGRIDYIGTNKDNPSRYDIEEIVKARWSIEVYHRELKQTCGIERCQSRSGRAQRNHICVSVMAWIKQHIKRCILGETFYQQNWNTIKEAIAYKLKITYSDCL